MSTIEIITIVLSSSILASIFTIWGNFQIQKNNFKKAYYTKLLDKRLEAYKKVEWIIASLKRNIQIESGETSPEICANGQDGFTNFFNLLGAAMDESIWLSDQIGTQIMELNLFLLTKINHRIDENKNYDEQLLKMGVHRSYEIKKFRSAIETQLYKDLQSLDEIMEFVKRTKTPSVGIPLEKKPIQLQKRKDK